jgi:hypothetical protein
MRDTFTKVFPSYVHGEGTVYKAPSMAHEHYAYPERSLEGKKMSEIDRTYTKKLDFLKKYTEEILKISNMRRSIK